MPLPALMLTDFAPFSAVTVRVSLAVEVLISALESLPTITSRLLLAFWVPL